MTSEEYDTDCDEGLESTKNSENTQLFLVNHVQKCPEVLQKSQIPSMKAKKNVSLETICDLYQTSFGKTITIKQLLKKINNMKTRLKEKTDKNQTGNKRINLQTWEKILLDIMEGGSNPTIVKVPGAIQCGVSSLQTENQAGSSASVSERTPEAESNSNTKPSKKPRIHYKTDRFETDETRGLNTIELQRIVLIEQLQAARAQKKQI